MKLKAIIIAAAMMFGVSAVSAQSHKALKINEVMVANDTSITDEYGMHQAWIEVFNSNFGPLEISSVFLTTDPSNPKMYAVPLGDKNTRIGKRQTAVFFADGSAEKGTFHTNFTLDPSKPNWIAIYDAGGVLIDSVTVPVMERDQSFARTEDGVGEWQVRDGSKGLYITPGGNNVIKGVNPKIEEFKERDENGWGMTLMAMCIVFCALLVLCLCFYGIGRIGAFISRSNKMRSQGLNPADREMKAETSHDSGEEIAAIAMAMHEHFNAHDKESSVLTINKVKRAYSPWSSKIYNLRQVPELQRNAPRRK